MGGGAGRRRWAGRSWGSPRRLMGGADGGNTESGECQVSPR